MKVQERFQKQLSLAMMMHFNGSTHGQILRRLQDAFLDAVSARTLSYWIANFKSLEKEGISRDAPFELHLMEEYALPIEASPYISDMIYELTQYPRLPMFPSHPAYEARNWRWEPTVREIDWWWRVHNMADDFSYQDVYLVASHYYVRDLLEEIGGIPANYSDLNAFMTYKPWRNEGRTENYKDEIKSGTFTAIDASDYPTRGIFDEEGDWVIGDSVRVIWKWSQMANRKYLSPHKALIMTIIVSGRLPMASQGFPKQSNAIRINREEMDGLEILLGELNILGELNYHDEDFTWTPEIIEAIKEIADGRGLKVPSKLAEAIDIKVRMDEDEELTIDNYEEILWPVFNKEEYEAIKEHVNQKSELE